jgi:hypothetical protein
VPNGEPGALAFTNTKDIAMKLAIQQSWFAKVFVGSVLFLSTAMADALPVSSVSAMLSKVDYSNTLKKVSDEYNCRDEWNTYNDSGVAGERSKNLENAKAWYNKGRLDVACMYLCKEFNESMNLYENSGAIHNRGRCHFFKDR